MRRTLPDTSDQEKLLGLSLVTVKLIDLWPVGLSALTLIGQLLSIRTQLPTNNRDGVVS
jgi:hypothetical protein